MMDTLTGLLAAAGPSWMIAAIAVVLAAACDSAKPKDEQIARGALGVLPGFAALVAPLLLLVHGFWAVAPHQAAEVSGSPMLVSVMTMMQAPTLIALGIVIAVLLFFPSILGWVIGKASPSLGGALYRVSPWLNLAALAFAVFVTYRSVATVLDLALNRPG